jgi:hypothetical protein
MIAGANGSTVAQTRSRHAIFVRPVVVLYLQLVVTELRRRIAGVLALCVFVLTFGQVQVNSTGRSTTDGPGRADAHVSAKRTP